MSKRAAKIRSRSGRFAVAIAVLWSVLPASLGGASDVDGSPVRSGNSSGIAGSVEYHDGEFVYTDFVFDDTGPSGLPSAQSPFPQGQRQFSRLGAGHAEYPHDWDRYGDNAADLVEVRATADSDAVHYLFRLNALMQDDSTVIGLAVDEDLDLSSGGGAWPHRANLSLDGWDRLYTVWGTGGTITVAGAEPVDLATLGAELHTDLDQNTIEVTIPRSVADPGQDVWRMWGAVGLWDVAADAWLGFAPVADESSPAVRFAGAAQADAFPAVFNVAFRPMTEPGDFGNDPQGIALANGDISAYSAEVDFGKIEQGYSDPSTPPPSGVYTRVYRSHLPGEGVVDLKGRPCYEAIAVDHQPWKYPTCQDYYLSRYQPYKVTVPGTYSHGTPSPVVITSHGYNEYFEPDAGWEEPLEANGAIGVFAMGRGQGTMYVRAAERDILEVLADVKDYFNVDDDRISAVGGSHGGLFVWLMASQHPDLFSAAFPVIPGYIKHDEFGTENDVVLNASYLPLGPQGDRLQNVAFKVSELFENLRNVPVRVLTGDEDPASPPGRYEITVTDRLAELGYDYIHYGCSVHTHGPISAELGDQLIDWLIHQVRVEDPRFVVYKGNTGADRWNEPWGNRHDGAYWVSDIKYSDPGSPFLARAESFALAETDAEPVPLSGQMVTGDTPPSVCHYKGVQRNPTSPLPVSNRLDLELTNLAELTVDASRSGLRLDEPLELVTESDHRVRLLLTGLSVSGLEMEIDGTAVPTSVSDGEVVVEIPPGSHRYLLIETGP